MSENNTVESTVRTKETPDEVWVRSAHRKISEVFEEVETEKSYGQIKGEAVRDICKYVRTKYPDISLIEAASRLDNARAHIETLIRLDISDTHLEKARRNRLEAKRNRNISHT